MLNLEFNNRKYLNQGYILLGVLLAFCVLYLGLERILQNSSSQAITDDMTNLIFVVSFVIMNVAILAGVLILIYSITISYKVLMLRMYRSKQRLELTDTDIFVQSPLDYQVSQIPYDTITSIKLHIDKTLGTMTVVSVRGKFLTKKKRKFVIHTFKSDIESARDFLLDKNLSSKMSITGDWTK